MSTYPTDLHIGDRMRTKTGREYVVTNADLNYVTYAYVPAFNKDNKIALDTMKYNQLKWVDEVVDDTGQVIYTKFPSPKVDDTVMYNGKSFRVTKTYGGNDQYVTLERSVHVAELDK